MAKVANCPLYIVHLSAAQALAAVAQARDTGQNVFAETCPQYLYLSLDDLARPDFEGAKFVASPPLRPKEHQDSLWRGLRTNDLSVVSTDHCPFCFKDGKDLGRGDFSKIPNGMPGVEHRMDLLHQGVVAGQLSLPRWVEVASTTPARMFGLYPRKGVIAAGVNSFKMFMAYPGVFYATDGEILLAMQQAARLGATICMHAENGIAIDQLVAQALAAGRTDPVYHGLTRPPELEGEATSRAITLAAVAACPLYIVHLSARQALAAVAEARDTGQNVFAETCPQYLYLSLDDLARPDFEGAKFVASPPLRPKDHQDSLWRGLRTNDLSVVSTDHCPFCFKDGKELGRGDFSKIPNGMPGVEHRMDLLHQGVVAGQLSLPRWVEVASTTPARMFGLYPRKGVIAAGSDADIVIYDPQATQTLSAATHHMNVDYSAYEGLEITGRVVTTLSRGRVVIDDGRYLGRTGDGTFLARGLNQYLL
ncbi:MAG TPA: dihydropyrimidinase [Streptosporangiaceae bacterium]|nr:dihydropyrimidinase [Streptosporangiaceae bacterium]